VSELAPRESASPEPSPRDGEGIAPREQRPIAFREDLPVPEPWSRTLWEVGKPLPLSLGLVYGLQTLFIPGDNPLGWTWFLWMGGFFGVQGVMQRRKGMFHPQSLIAFGGLTAAASLLVIVSGLISGERDGLIMGLVFVSFSAIILVAGLRSRTLERERVARLEAESVNPATIEGAMPVATLRERMQRFREAMSRANKTLFAGFAGVIATTMGGLMLSSKYEWPEVIDLGLFGLFWAGIGSMMWYTNHITRKAAREAELDCPACNRPLVGTLGSQRLMAQLEDLGRCPQCAARITVEVL
jgi:hypothetical protein